MGGTSPLVVDQPSIAAESDWDRFCRRHLGEVEVATPACEAAGERGGKEHPAQTAAAMSSRVKGGIESVQRPE